MDDYTAFGYRDRSPADRPAHGHLDLPSPSLIPHPHRAPISTAHWSSPAYGLVYGWTHGPVYDQVHAAVHEPAGAPDYAPPDYAPPDDSAPRPGSTPPRGEGVRETAHRACEPASEGRHACAPHRKSDPDLGPHPDPGAQPETALAASECHETGPLPEPYAGSEPLPEPLPASYAGSEPLPEPLPEPDLDGDPGQLAAVPSPRSHSRRHHRRRHRARRSAVLTIAVPSAAMVGVAAAAVAGVAVSHGPVRPPSATAAHPVPAPIDPRLSGIGRDIRDYIARASRDQQRLDLEKRAEAARERAEREAAERKERLRPKFALPVSQPGLSAYFGQMGINWMSFHTGIDFPVNVGTPVRAATDGTVSTDWNPSYGNMVKVTAPDGTQTWYCHLRSARVRSGTVQAGEVIAYSGNTGNTTGPHLHFEVRPDGGEPIDPLPWLLSHDLDPRN